MPMVNGMCEETAHAFITLHKDRIEFKVMLPYAKGGFISGSDPYGAEANDFPIHWNVDEAVEYVRERFIVGQTILRLIRLNGVASFEIYGGDDLPDAEEYRGGDYGDDDVDVS